MPERIAKVDQVYALRQVKAGERFHVEPEDVRTLSILGRIEDEAPAAEAPTYPTRELRANSSRRQRGAGH